MRRSTRLSTKRTNFSPDSSDEDKPKQSKSKPKIKLPRKNLKQQNSDADAVFKSNKKKKSKSSKTSSGSSSESDIENYLQPADQIDLNSTFFDVTKPEERKSFDTIESNIFAGINRLSDSESEFEFEIDGNQIPSSSKKRKKKTVKDPKLLPAITFQHVEDYATRLEEAKKVIQKYEANKKKKEKKQEMCSDNKLELENNHISSLLALGENKLDSSTEPAELQPSINSSDFESFSESEKEDWEEVEEQDTKDTQGGVVIPKDDLQITVELPTIMRQKRGKDLVASMKRRLNRIRKENQVLVHKVHLLCWIGHGNYVNEVLNDEGILALLLSLVPGDYSYQSSKKDLNYVEKILKWYKTTMPNIEKRPSKDMSLDKLLKLQIICKEAFSKKMLVYIFVCLLRSLGVDCRLVLSFQVTPLKPPANELHSLSTKNDDKKDIKEKNQEVSNSEDQNLEIKNDDDKIQTNMEGEQLPEKKVVRHTAGGKKVKIPKNESHTLEGNKKTRNSKRNINLDPESEKVDEKKTRKTKQKLNKMSEKENDIKNQNISTDTPFINDSKTNDAKQEDASLRNVKTTKKESLKIKLEGKAKTRSQSTKEEKSPNKTFNQLNAKPATRSKSTSQLDFKENTSSNGSQMKKRVSLSLKNRNNNRLSPKVPQLDGADDSDDESTISQKTNKVRSKKLPEEKSIQNIAKKHSRRIKSLPDYKEVNSDDDFKSERPKRSTKSNTQKSESVKPKEKLKRKSIKNQTNNESDQDSDYTPQATKNKQNDSEDEFYESKIRVKQRIRTKKEADDVEPKPKKGFDIWIEVYLEAENKWVSVDVIEGRVISRGEMHMKTSHPITYIVAWNNDNSIKDITQRYCPRYNTVTRKLQIDKNWWNDAIHPFEGQRTLRDEKEDEELAQMQLEQALPTTIHEYKNHPLYVLKRHLLKFEALYPPEPAILGFVRKEAVYSRDCVHKLRTRESWYKQAQVVKPGEKSYKILKTVKWDKISRQFLKDQPLEVFGAWQVEDYVPPTAQNGLVPRNEYGNVELFQTCMLPKGTVHLQLPSLNKLARRMNIDCAPAMVGFDFHSGWNHPVYDGYVVCEEHSESLIAAWYMEQEEQEKREQEKTEKRIYGNWKKLIKGLLIRERLQARYNFGEPTQGGSAAKKGKSKAPKFVSKKRRHCENETESDDD